MIRKEYEFKIRFPRLFKVDTIILRYKEASIREVIEFEEEQKKYNFRLRLWVLWFIKKHAVNYNKKYELNFLVNYQTIFDKLKDTYFRGIFDNKSKNKDIQKIPFESYIGLIAKELNLDYNELLNEYTLNQLENLGKGALRNLRAQTKEGQKQNEKEFNKEYFGTGKHRQQLNEKQKQAIDKFYADF